jgi:pyruvate/2-oxoglutarate/acetoin dehydrogenase E1 component
VTLVSIMKGVQDCLTAASMPSSLSVDAEVIDLRTLRPFDRDTILKSLAKTNRLVAGEVLASAVEGGLHEIDDAWRLTTPDHPIPFSPPLEDAFLPGVDAIVASVSERLGVGSQPQSHAGSNGG